MLSLNGVAAADFVLDYRHGVPNKFSKQDMNRGLKVRKWFLYTLTNKEKAALGDEESDIGELRQVLKNAHDLILKLLHDAFVSHPTAKVPRCLKPGATTSMSMSFIPERLKTLKQLKNPKSKLQESAYYFQNSARPATTREPAPRPPASQHAAQVRASLRPPASHRGA